MLNKTILIGILGGDPEIRYTSGGVPVSTVRVGVKRPFANAAGEYEMDWLDVVLWRQSAEFAANYCKKNDLVSVEGRNQVRSFQGQDGRRTVVEIVAESFQRLRSASQGSQSGAQRGAGAESAASEDQLALAGVG